MQQFQLVDYIPWVGSVIAEIVVLAIMLKRNLPRRFPIFFSSVVYDVVRQVALAFIAYRSPRAYAYGYWISIPIEYVIAFGVMLEAFRYALGANPKIPPKTLRVMAVVAVLLVALAAFLLFHPDIPISNLRGFILTLDRSIDLLRCGVVIFIWAFAKKLGLSWAHHVWGIVCGLGIYSAVGLIAAGIHAVTGDLCGDWLARSVHLSYFAATVVWAVYLWRPEPHRGPLTLERIALIENLIATYRRIMAELWRSFRNDRDAP